MFKAILFDLDGTLLNIDMEYFLKKYFEKMMSMAREYGIKNYDRLVQQVYKSTEVMIMDRDPSTTNEDAFMKDFFSCFGQEEKMREFFDLFYQEGFPQLQKYCRPWPGVLEMMEKVLARHRVVIATNAVFPLKALQDRVNWAGIGHLDYEFITSYEIMHFCKPHIEYYQEIVDRLQVNPQDCLMVGNDMGEDLPAQELGMKTFLVEDMLIPKDVSYQPDWRGTLNDLIAFMDQLDT